MTRCKRCALHVRGVYNTVAGSCVAENAFFLMFTVLLSGISEMVTILCVWQRAFTRFNVSSGVNSSTAEYTADAVARVKILGAKNMSAVFDPGRKHCMHGQLVGKKSRCPSTGWALGNLRLNSDQGTSL